VDKYKSVSIHVTRQHVLDFSEAYINYVRVGLAIAIIKIKPKDIASKTYVEQLRKQIEEKQANYKEECDRLKAELLMLRQSHAMTLLQMQG